ncbi:TetR/AcrR family transcriptional regulator [Clavibacter nebraskensis]|uniref:TetR/AcrR family transcriptional regulator n=2 Tax=Clavibacter nebraskensis TaxID=31963 RepID=A0A399PHU9_9MICO|nr:TetR family transcriptional regulator [Clavibacter nebraskensis]CCE74107.1 transcriptional regulator, TetR-family [Clavibacter nebraskensis NCPPB 2581]OAH18920.1 TetR family transcriptional regulator [Clavibacter nebraskensis]QGV65502.1 TetR/AcrR family transcriptional regulator [Clavibacter nebraskensis]QGV68300.1 TetR/AcrR family transcriptional regulator [Clavibacter nebraskensis]
MLVNEHRTGRVRSEAAREAILGATVRLIHAVGYDHLTIEGVAKEAGVGKQTIYRWWPSRGALIAECMTEGRLIPVEFAVPDTGDLLADIERWLTDVLAVLDAPAGGPLVRSLVAAAAEDEAVGDHLGSSLGVDRGLSERLASGIRAGQLPADAPVEELGQAILGVIVLRVLGRKADHAESVTRLVRFVLGSGGATERTARR